jgi:uncharacterized protein (DUF2141 family)
MNSLKQFHWFLYIFFILVIACARQTAPTGGPKDTIPPRLIASKPKTQQLNYKENSLELTFTEAVELATPKEQLIITPTIGKDYQISAKKNHVTVKWNQLLPDSTTYTFNFRESVKDITEKNSARNLRIAFSTGPYIDSLMLQGKIVAALEQTPVKDATVALQPYSDTFNILKHQPTYFTKSDDKGIFKIENLKNTTYLLYAFTDQNRNLVADSKSERFGFIPKPVNLDTANQTITVPIVKRDMRALKITGARPYNTYFNIKTSKNIEGVAIEQTNNVKTVYSFGADRSNILVYNTFGAIDSVQLHVSLYDSIQNRIDTTVYAKFASQKVTPEKFQATISKLTFIADKGFITGTISLTKPLSKILYDSIIFDVDSLTKIHFTEKDFQYNQVEKTIQITKKVDPSLFKNEVIQPGEEAPLPDTLRTKKPKKLNSLIFHPASLISIENDSSSAISQKLTPLHFEDLGVIIVNFYTKQTVETITELVGSDKQVLSSKRNATNIQFEDLPPNDYQIRVIIDQNANGKWDGGNYLKGIEPEPIIYYENEKHDRTVKLKANFEIGPLLITY